MSKEFIEDMIVRFKNDKRLHRKYVYRILWDIKRILMEEPTMVEIGVEDTHTLTICGDTHGIFLSKFTNDRSIL
jgi:serine/threonine-protein phosphatase 5